MDGKRDVEGVYVSLSLCLVETCLEKRRVVGHIGERGDKLRQHPRTRLLLRFWNASPSLPPPPRHSRAIPFSGYGAMCCWRDDIRKIERRVKYLWPNQMRGRGASPDKSREILTPNDSWPDFPLLIAVYCRFVCLRLLYDQNGEYGEFVEELRVERSYRRFFHPRYY